MGLSPAEFVQSDCSADLCLWDYVMQEYVTSLCPVGLYHKIMSHSGKPVFILRSAHIFMCKYGQVKWQVATEVIGQCPQKSSVWLSYIRGCCVWQQSELGRACSASRRAESRKQQRR